MISASKNRVVMIHAGGIGDLILASPAIARLASEYAVDLVGYPERLALLTESGMGERALSLDAVDLASLYSEPSTRARELFSSAQRVVAWMKDDDGRLTESLRACGVGEVQFLAPLPPEDWSEHASDYYWQSAGFAGKSPLPSLLGDKQQTDPKVTIYDVIIHPGSGSPKKNWPLENFDAIAASLEANGLSVGWVAGPAERERLTDGTAGTRTWLPEITLVELGRLLARTPLYLGNDSGITHLAAAVGCPTIAIFGPTNPALWRPRGAKVIVLHGEPWPALRGFIDSMTKLVARQSIN